MMRDEEFIRMRMEEGATPATEDEARRPPWLSRLARRLRRTDHRDAAASR
jgi:hypothetical protein